MAKSSIPSLELERSMNLQARVMTIEEALRHSSVIDELDDKRRAQLHEIIIWTKEQHNTFKESATGHLKEKLESFIEKFNQAIDSILKKELELEDIDDKNREFLIKYAVTTRENLKNENSSFEKEIIKRRIEKWLDAQTAIINLGITVLRKSKDKQ